MCSRLTRISLHRASRKSPLHKLHWDVYFLPSDVLSEALAEIISTRCGRYSLSEDIMDDLFVVKQSGSEGREVKKGRTK